MIYNKNVTFQALTILCFIFYQLLGFSLIFFLFIYCTFMKISQIIVLYNSNFYTFLIKRLLCHSTVQLLKMDRYQSQTYISMSFLLKISPKLAIYLKKYKLKCILWILCINKHVYMIYELFQTLKYCIWKKNNAQFCAKCWSFLFPRSWTEVSESVSRCMTFCINLSRISVIFPHISQKECVSGSSFSKYRDASKTVARRKLTS